MQKTVKKTMGHREDKDVIVYGDDCNKGEVLAKPLWANGETPKYVYVRFSGIQRCETPRCVGVPLAPNDRVFKLTQTVPDSCLWMHLGDWEVTWSLLAGLPQHVFFDLFWRPWMAHYFYADYETDGDNARFTHNQVGCGDANTCGYGGVATVEFGKESMEIRESLNIAASDKLFMEMHPLVDGNRVYKYCRLRDATNIKIEFEPD